MFNCAAVALIAAVSLARVSTSLPLGRVINYRRGSAIGDGDVAFDSYPFKRALVVAAHPDDIETICGGVVAQFVDQGIDVAYVITTNGDKVSPNDFVQWKRAARLQVPPSSSHISVALPGYVGKGKTWDADADPLRITSAYILLLFPHARAPPPRSGVVERL